ncbi:MAG: exodeoxyribonuclease VII small subunit [Actinomycetota bacterium]|nr:exodeoxyribonuclease VII small subunit [Actinomycetota bacterium]
MAESSSSPVPVSGAVSPALGRDGIEADLAAPEAHTFEQLMAELETVTEALATGELGIEAAADLYERAERLHALATARLAQVQARVDGLRAERTS